MTADTYKTVPPRWTAPQTDTYSDCLLKLKTDAQLRNVRCALEDSNVEVRRRSMRFLERAEAAYLIDFWDTLILDSDSDTANSAIRLLAKLERAGAPFTHALQRQIATNPACQDDASITLAHVAGDNPQIMAWLADRLRYPGSPTKEAISYALTNCDAFHDKVIETLFSNIGRQTEPNPSALVLLDLADHMEVLPAPVIEQLESLDAVHRYWAVRVLLRVKDPTVLIPIRNRLVRLLQDSDADVRTGAVAALGRIVLSTEGNVALLEGALNDDDDDARYAAAEALQSTASSADALVCSLQDQDSTVRKRALESLTSLKFPNGTLVPVLDYLQANPDVPSGDEAVWAIADVTIDSPRVESALELLLLYGEDNYRQVAAEALVRTPTTRSHAITVIQSALDGPDGDYSVTQALRAIQDPPTSLLTSIAACLRTEEWNSRALGIGACKSLGPNASFLIAELLAMLPTADEQEVISILEAVESVKPSTEYLGIVRHLFEESASRYVRSATVRVIAAIDKKSDGDLLLLARAVAAQDDIAQPAIEWLDEDGCRNTSVMKALLAKLESEPDRFGTRIPSMLVKSDLPRDDIARVLTKAWNSENRAYVLTSMKQLGPECKQSVLNEIAATQGKILEVPGSEELLRMILPYSTPEELSQLVPLLACPSQRMRATCREALELVGPRVDGTFCAALDAALARVDEAPACKFLAYVSARGTDCTEHAEVVNAVLDRAGLHARDERGSVDLDLLRKRCRGLDRVLVDSDRYTLLNQLAQAELGRGLQLGESGGALRWSAEEDGELIRGIATHLVNASSPVTPVAHKLLQRLSPPPWYQSSWASALWAWVAANVLVFITIMWARSATAHWTKWAPGTLGTIAVACGSWIAHGSSGMVVSLPVLWVLVGLEGIVLVGFGVVHPRILDATKALEPMNFVCTLMLVRVGACRRRLYHRQWSEVDKWIKAQRQNANHECYVDLGATMFLSTEIAGNRDSSVDRTSDATLVELLRARKGVRCIMVTGDPGLGKSALLRRVLELVQEGAKSKNEALLPLVLERTEANVPRPTQVEAKLREVLASQVLAESVLVRAHVLVVIDDIDKTEVAALKSLVANKSDEDLRLLVTSRPNRELELEFLGPGNRVVMPRPLDGTTMPEFLRAYNATTALPTDMLATCQRADGSYSPLLVRLALLSGDNSPNGIAGLFDGALKRLIGGDAFNSANVNATIEDAGKVCLQTYWLSGRRDIEFARWPRQLVDTLLAAGVLVEPIPRAFGREVRFFHDSMLNFVTASAICSPTNARRDADLLRACSDEMFSAAVGEDRTDQGSELFQFCVTVYPRATLAGDIEATMLEWANRHRRRRLGIQEDVLQVVSDSVKTALEGVDGAWATFEEAVHEIRRQSEATSTMEDLVRLYRHVGRRVYRWQNEAG